MYRLPELRSCGPPQGGGTLCRPMAPVSRPVAVAVAGGSGSGKTTLARAIAARLGSRRCAVLDHDSYYRDLAHLPPQERATVNFDHPESLDSGLLAEHLDDLRRGRTILRPHYDFATHTRRSGTERIEPRPFLVCEGILLLAATELTQAFDLRVYLDVPADVRVLRRVERDTAERGRSVRSVVRQYLATVRPMHERFVAPARVTADLVLGWRDSVEDWTDSILDAITRQPARSPARRQRDIPDVGVSIEPPS